MPICLIFQNVLIPSITQFGWRNYKKCIVSLAPSKNGFLVTLEDVSKLSNFTRKHQSSVILHVVFHSGQFRVQFCSYHFFNDISQFAVEACVLNMYADDVIIHTSAVSKDELECRLQVCIDNISNWYSMNKLCINKNKSSVMVFGSKWQLKSLNLDDFIISVDSNKLFLARQATCLGLWVKNDLSWDDHILELCRKCIIIFICFIA